MEFDGTLDLAVGFSARSKTWKNKKWKWSSLVKKLLKENKTTETFKEYQGANKTDRNKIKDVGGYVGGYVKNGRRKAENIVYRQLLTLDLDFAHLEIWSDFCLLFGNAAVIHATHSHSKKTPKYRLILPLNREASPDEYIAVGRYIAGELGIDYFDDTGFQPDRLMFWPSNPKDVKYYAEFQDGPWVDVEEVLQTYPDWTDSSLWPTSSGHSAKMQSLVKKQENPKDKKGVVGSFCRTYSIEDGITEFLEDVYTPTDEGRYTYTLGSTASGLVVYNGLFAYSHHGTDPCSGKLSNIFDLVRLHKFGHLDEGLNPNVVKSKSYKAMSALVLTDKKTKATIAQETIQGAIYDFAEDEADDFIYAESDEEVEETDLTWAEELEIDARGKYLSSANNLNIIFSNDPKLSNLFKFNKFDNKRYIFDSVPWRKIEKPEPIRNVDYSGIRNYIESVYAIVGNSKIDDALALQFEKQSFHPVKDYLGSLKWDKTKRINNVLKDYFGAVDNVYTEEAIRKTLVGAVARIYNPGIKFDLVLTIVGGQGTGKSTFVNKLGSGFSSDSFNTVHGKDSFEQLGGAWLIEMAELSGLRKAEVEAIKHFISKQEDTYRPAYARTVETFKRQCVFIGTTNNSDFLTDPSGNRRFMPIDINELRITKSIFKIEQKEIDQIWAEAIQLYKKGEKLYLSNAAEKIARVEQRGHSRTDERTGLVEQYLATLLPVDWEEKDLFARQQYLEDPLSPVGKYEREAVCVAELWCECLGKSKTEMSKYNTRDLNDIMKSLPGWHKAKSVKNFKYYGKQRYYSRSIF